jgi:hypothetical protein
LELAICSVFYSRQMLECRRFANSSAECFNLIIETGVLHEVGLRDTLEPDPGNTGVGSFGSEAAFLFEIVA